MRYSERLADAGIEPSAGRVGDSCDNALAETINGLRKAEAIHRRAPRRNLEAAGFATLEWVGWFNSRRRLEPISHVPPAEAEANHHAMLDDLPAAAQHPNQYAPGKPGGVHISLVAGVPQTHRRVIWPSIRSTAR